MAAAGKKKAGAGAARARERERLAAAAAATELPGRADVCVLGGGAAGLAAAITAAEAGLRVVVLERDLECGRTILATGNGRCNFANTRLVAGKYNQPEFVDAVFGTPADALKQVLDFFGACGMSWAEEEGRLYPRSRQAASVRNVLLSRAARAGVTLACGREVTGAVPADAGDGWIVSFTETWEGGAAATLAADSLVFAGGGASHALAAELGLPVVADEPVLCALAAQGPMPGVLEALDGRRAHCMASLTRGAHVVAREEGEALFRPYGLSGIVSFDLSRVARPGDMLELDLAPEVDAWEVDGLVAQRPGDAHALDGILDPVIAAELIKLAGGVNFGGLAWRVAPLVKGLPLRITGKADEARAQVTRGGISVACASVKTLGIEGRPGLFACGEALDVDGACGGFNLAWAWLSGMRAGTSAAELGRAAREKREAEAAAAAEAARLAAEKAAEADRLAVEKAAGGQSAGASGSASSKPNQSKASGTAAKPSQKNVSKKGSAC